MTKEDFLSLKLGDLVFLNLFGEKHPLILFVSMSYSRLDYLGRDWWIKCINLHNLSPPDATLV